MIVKINDNKNVFSSIVCEVNATVFFFINIIFFKTQIKTPQVTFIKTNQPKTQIRTPQVPYIYTICTNKNTSSNFYRYNILKNFYLYNI